MMGSKAKNRYGNAVAIAAVCLLSGLGVATATAADTHEGKEVFAQTAVPSCAVCHTLADAGSQGNIGPNLDELQPSAERVFKAVTGGIGAMPPYEGKLSEQQREAVAEYVSSVAAGS